MNKESPAISTVTVSATKLGNVQFLATRLPIINTNTKNDNLYFFDTIEFKNMVLTNY